MKVKKRTIFDTATWADEQKYQSEQMDRYKKQIAELNKRLTEIQTPLTPEQDVNMETEETGHTAIKEQIENKIEVELKAPKGYILFPEPPQEKEEPIYIAEEVQNDSET